MSKDEYLITDAPLKALTVFAMPMILGSFLQLVPVQHLPMFLFAWHWAPAWVPVCL